jgi:Lrp/AsnC family transcriptional regulator for asnA, asnC and gidA
MRGKELNASPKIDEVDVKILKALLKDARTSFADIAKDCGMSTNSIRIRFERLKKAGIIKGAITQINPKSLGYNCIALLGIQVDPTKEKSVYNFLEKTPNLILNSQLIGRYDITSIAAIKSVDDLGHIIKVVSGNPHVRKVETSIWFDIIEICRPENLEIKNYEGT